MIEFAFEEFVQDLYTILVVKYDTILNQICIKIGVKNL